MEKILKLYMDEDLLANQWILDKVCSRDAYAQNLYAAMCNNKFQKIDVWPILKDEYWSCSWRSAGAIVAEMRGQGDYMDWYCSGIRDVVTDQAYMDMTQEEKAQYETVRGFVSESVVTEEIKSDLNQLGWAIFPHDET